MSTATLIKTEDITVSIGLAELKDAELIAKMFEEALGKDGIGGLGHEPYPDPALFSAAGIKSIIEHCDRCLVIAKVGQRPVGGMVIDYLSPYQCEFNCMAVAKDMRGLNIGSKVVAGCRELVDKDLFTMNSTELVTHSMLSQSAHFGEGYNKITGFSFCHYPNVFFANHPESVLWVTKAQGKLLTTLQGIKQGNVALNDKLPANELQIVKEVLRKRSIYVPNEYANLVKQILQQFDDTFNYEVISTVKNAINSPVNGSGCDIDWKEGYGHCYISSQPGFQINAKELDTAIDSIQNAGKRFILYRLPANDSNTIEVANQLRQKGFVFHSILPLYGFDKHKDGSDHLYDILTLQWIAPKVLAANPLPGQTNSVVHLYGYPINLTGQIIKLISNELKTEKSTKG